VLRGIDFTVGFLPVPCFSIGVESLSGMYRMLAEKTFSLFKARGEAGV
jgi:hypothetical protein